MNVFWDFSVASRPAAVAPESDAPPTPKSSNSLAKEAFPEPTEPARDEVTNPERGGQEGESRDEEKTDSWQNRAINHGSDLSMFSTLTELLFNPFSDGYCKTPFCSDADYLPPSCPSGGFYTTPDQVRVKPPQDYACDQYGDICRSGSAASSGVSSQGRRRRQRPLAFAVGHGDEWKDREGRRVVITPRRPYQTNSPSKSRYSTPGRGPQGSRCACASPTSTNSLIADRANNNHDDSPHQTKSVICKSCTGLYALEAPSSLSSETNNLPPMAEADVVH